MDDNVWGLRLFMRDFFIAAMDLTMLNPSLKSRFMQEFSRFRQEILEDLVG